MNDTFFVPSFGNRPRNLVGRKEILKQFQSGLGSPVGSRERVMLMLGQRGYGKTVLLLELADMARNLGYIVASPTVVARDMPKRILEKLRLAGESYLPKEKARLTGGNINVLGFGAGIQVQENAPNSKSFALQLSELCTQLQGHPILILVDEVQASNEELRQLIVAYQELVGEGRDIAMVLAGLPHSISSVLNDHVLTFLNRAVKMDLPPLKTNDICAYYTLAFADLGLSVDMAQIKTAAETTCGHPYLMQLLGHYITLYTDETGGLSEDLFRQARSSASEDFKNDICQTELAALSDRDIDFLRAMSTDDDLSELSAVAQRLACSPAYAQTYKRRLMHAGIIEQPRRGNVRFAVPFLKEYLREYE